MRLLELQALVEEELARENEVPKVATQQVSLCEDETCDLSLFDIVRDFAFTVKSVTPYKTQVGKPPPNWVRVAIEYCSHAELQKRFTALKNEGCPCGGNIVEIKSATGKFWGCDNARRYNCKFFPSFKWEHLKFLVNMPSEKVVEYLDPR